MKWWNKHQLKVWLAALACLVVSYAWGQNVRSTPDMSVASVATALGGATPYHLIGTASNNSTLVSTGQHTLYNVEIINMGAAVQDFRLYDLTAAPTCSSATGVVQNYAVPFKATTSGDKLEVRFPVGLNFANGLGFCQTATVADNDNTNATAGVTINLSYK